MTIQLCTAKIPRQRTVRAASTRTSASGCPAAGGRSPALERSAVCQSMERSPSKYFAADTAIGPISNSKKTITDFPRACPQLEDSKTYYRVIHRRSADSELTDAPLRPSGRSMGQDQGYFART